MHYSMQLVGTSLVLLVVVSSKHLYILYYYSHIDSLYEIYNSAGCFLKHSQLAGRSRTFFASFLL